MSRVTTAVMLAVLQVGLIAQAPAGGQAPGGRAGGRGGGRPAPPILLTSSAFQDSTMPAAKYMCSTPPGPAINPPLAWSNVPDGVVSFILLYHDMEPLPRGGLEDITHWLMWNMPGTLRELPEGVAHVPELPDGSRQRGMGYGSPCPPVGDPFHHYVYELFALDIKLDAPVGASRADVMKAADGHILGHGVLVSLFQRK